MVDRIRWDTVSYLPFYYVFFQFLLLTIFNLQANILTTKDILSNLGWMEDLNDVGANRSFDLFFKLGIRESITSPFVLESVNGSPVGATTPKEWSFKGDSFVSGDTQNHNKSWLFCVLFCVIGKSSKFPQVKVFWQCSGKFPFLGGKNFLSYPCHVFDKPMQQI